MKEFIKTRITTKQLRSDICKFAKAQGVNKVCFNNNGKRVNGTYNAKTKTIYLDTKQTKIQLLRTFFHELGHHVAVNLNKWKNYHFCLVSRMRADLIFKIENSIDKIGKTLWHKYVDMKRWGNYKYSYPKHLKNHIITHFICNS